MNVGGSWPHTGVNRTKSMPLSGQRSSNRKRKLPPSARSHRRRGWLRFFSWKMEICTERAKEVNELFTNAWKWTEKLFLSSLTVICMQRPVWHSLVCFACSWDCLAVSGTVYTPFLPLRLVCISSRVNSQTGSNGVTGNEIVFTPSIGLFLVHAIWRFNRPLKKWTQLIQISIHSFSSCKPIPSVRMEFGNETLLSAPSSGHIFP